jgi:hypothetical protein
MKKKIFLVTGTLILIVLGYLAWEFLGPSTSFTGARHDFYVRTGMRYDEVVKALESDSVIHNPFFFSLLARKLDYPPMSRRGNTKLGRV